MKKVLLLAATMTALLSAPVQAQNTAERKGTIYYSSLGPVAGIGLNWVGNMAGSSKALVSSNIGLGMIYARDEHWAVGGQLVLSTEGYDVKYAGNEAKAIPTYIRMPLRAYYFFGDYKATVRPKLYAGPALGLKIAERDDMARNTGDVNLDRNTGSFRTFDLGLNVGTGVNVKLAKTMWLNLDLTYYQGVLDAVKDPANHYNTNQNLGINAGLLFGLK